MILYSEEAEKRRLLGFLSPQRMEGISAMCQVVSSHRRLSRDQRQFLLQHAPEGRVGKKLVERVARLFERNFKIRRVSRRVVRLILMRGSLEIRAKKPGSPHKPLHKQKRNVMACVS